MKKLLIVVDMQNDFIDGALGTEAAKLIVPKVKSKIREYSGMYASGGDIIFTRDTHRPDYLETQEGRYLPVPHCIEGTRGHEIADGLKEAAGGMTDRACKADGADGLTEAAGGIKTEVGGCRIFDKPNFGSLELAELAAKGCYDEIELCGLCTDICVVSNALILKTRLPETTITVDASCCAGVTEESHAAALQTMKMCQVNVLNAS